MIKGIPGYLYPFLSDGIASINKTKLNSGYLPLVFPHGIHVAKSRICAFISTPRHMLSLIVVKKSDDSSMLTQKCIKYMYSIPACTIACSCKMYWTCVASTAFKLACPPGTMCQHTSWFTIGLSFYHSDILTRIFFQQQSLDQQLTFKLQWTITIKSTSIKLKQKAKHKLKILAIAQHRES